MFGKTKTIIKYIHNPYCQHIQMLDEMIKCVNLMSYTNPNRDAIINHCKSEVSMVHENIIRMQLEDNVKRLHEVISFKDDEIKKLKKQLTPLSK